MMLRIAALTVLLAGAASSVEAAVITSTLQASRDTQLLGYGPYQDDNFGGREFMGVGTATGARSNAIVAFDLSGLDLRGELLSVTLRLHHYNLSSGGVIPVEVYEITAANANWVEGTAFGLADPDDGANWVDRDGSGPLGAWTGAAGLESAGTAYHTPSLAVKSISSSTADQAIVDFDLGPGRFSDLQAMLTSWQSTMPGLLLRMPTGFSTGGRITFYAREDLAPAEDLGPQLIITTAVPEPGTFVLLALAGLAMVWPLRRRGKLGRG